MLDNHAIALKTLVEAFHLEVVFAATDYDAIRLTVADVARPGLQLAGYLDHFEPMRLQVIGNVEYSYLMKLSEPERRRTLDRYFSYKIPALLIARNIAPTPETLELAQKYNVTLLRSVLGIDSDSIMKQLCEEIPCLREKASAEEEAE